MQKMQNKRDTQKDMAAASECSDIDTTESIVLVEENGIQDDVDICEYDSNTLQQNPLFELQWIYSVILKERKMKLFNLLIIRNM